MHEVLFFGCQSATSKGHYFFRPHFRKYDFDPKHFRDEQGRHLDGGFLEAQGVRDVQGSAAYRQLNGYSIVSWWDRSGDSRGASNSAFIVQGDHTPQEVMRLGAESFPTILPRQKAPITLPDGSVLLERK